jgi:hypothetical protein
MDLGSLQKVAEKSLAEKKQREGQEEGEDEKTKREGMRS